MKAVIDDRQRCKLGGGGVRKEAIGNAQASEHGGAGVKSESGVTAVSTVAFDVPLLAAVAEVLVFASIAANLVGVLAVAAV